LPSDLPIDKDAMKNVSRKEGYFPLHGRSGVFDARTAPGAPPEGVRPEKYFRNWRKCVSWANWLSFRPDQVLAPRETVGE